MYPIELLYYPAYVLSHTFLDLIDYLSKAWEIKLYLYYDILQIVLSR